MTDKGLQCMDVVCPASHAEFEKLGKEVRGVADKLSSKPSTRHLIMILVPVVLVILGWVGYIGNKQMTQLKDMHLSQQEMTMKVSDVDSSLAIMNIKHTSLTTLIEAKIRAGDKDHSAHDERIHRLEKWMDRTTNGKHSSQKHESMVGG